MTRNGKHRPARPRIEIPASASPEEAAAIAAAIEQFLRDTAPAPEQAPPRLGGWSRAALLEGVGLRPDSASHWAPGQASR
jgi:hypothetical protein